MMSLKVFRRWPKGRGCENGGITSRVDEIWALMEHESVPVTSAVRQYFRAEQRGPNYWALIPIGFPVGMCGPMFGGNLAKNVDGVGDWTGDRDTIFHVHDRFETPEQAEMLSK